MPISYIFQGIGVTFDGNDTASTFQTATLTIVGTSAEVPQLFYDYDSPNPGSTEAELDGSLVIGGMINGVELGENIIFTMEQITSPQGTHQIMGLEEEGTGRNYFFVIGGDPLTLPTSLSQFNALNDSIVSVGRIPGGPFGPNTPFLITDMAGVSTQSGNTMDGTAGDDTLTGTSGNDLLRGMDGSDLIDGGAGFDEIVPGNNTGGDSVRTGAGSDVVDYTGSLTGYQELTYMGDAAPIRAYVNGSENQGDISQNNSYDQLVNVANALNVANNPIGGFGLIGTAGNDEFILSVTADQWMSVLGGPGTDMYEIWGPGPVRLSFRGAETGAQVNLGTGVIANDGYGNAETLSGWVWELRGTAHNDTLVGSARNESFISEGGQDIIDGGDGFDRVRYDRNGVDGVTVNLDAGGASGTWNGAAFSNTLSNIEHVRGSNGNDRLTGAAQDDRLEGGNGTDVLIGADGHDTLIGGTAADDLRDVIYGGTGNDEIDGGHGNDELRGDAGMDTIVGGFGVDDIFGGDGDDQLTGQAWSDLIFGGAGSDFINGGFGFDRVNGGADADRFFHLGVADHGSDWIQDYDAAEGDVLVFGAAATRDQFQVNLTETQNAGDAGVEEAFVIYRPTGQILWALVDGGAQAEINLVIGGTEYDLLA